MINYKTLLEEMLITMLDEPERWWAVHELIETITDFREKQGPQNKIQSFVIKFLGHFGEVFVYRPRPLAVAYILSLLTEGNFVKRRIESKDGKHPNNSNRMTYQLTP